MKGTTNTSASQRTQVRSIDGSYLMIYAYKTQDIASCKTLCKYIFIVLSTKTYLTGVCYDLNESVGELRVR